MDHDESRQLVRDQIVRWVPRGRSRRRGFKLSGKAPRKISVIPNGRSMRRIRNCPWPRSFRPEKRMTALTRGGLP